MELSNNTVCLELLKKKIGKNFDIYLTTLHIDGDEMYLFDGNIVISNGQDSYINIFSFEDIYFKDNLYLNSLHFYENLTPCYFSMTPLKEIMNGSNMPNIVVATRQYGVLEDVNLYYCEETQEEEKVILTKAIAFVFSKKILCFMSDYKNTNRTNFIILSKEGLNDFMKQNSLFKLYSS